MNDENCIIKVTLFNHAHTIFPPSNPEPVEGYWATRYNHRLNPSTGSGLDGE